ncbi:MAG: hypothetical protein ACRC3B_03555 [Bacteroidia bacterium]
MKTKYPAIVIALIISISMIASPLLNIPPVLDELIVEIPNLSAKTESAIRARFTSAPGVYFNGYCEIRKIYLLRIDRSVQPNNDFLENILHNDYQYSYFVKEDCTIEQVRVICNMPSSSAGSEQNPQ